MKHTEFESKKSGSTARSGLLNSVCAGLLAFSAQVDADVMTMRTVSCAPDSGSPIRHIQLREYTKSDIRCDVQYAKPDEGGIIETIWKARNSVSFCKTRFGEFIEKHQVKFGWDCTESAQVAGLNSVPEDAGETSSTGDSTLKRNDEVPEKVVWASAPELTATANATEVNGSLDQSTFSAYPITDGDLVARKVQNIASTLEAQKIGYNTEDLSDCSGVFHRVLASLQQHFPTIELPKPSSHRSTRKLARWYSEHGSLKVVESAVDEGDALRPGVVLFFGQRGKRYDDATPEELFTIGSGIAHMGVVVDVNRVDGQVVGYSLFHGRRTGTNASITNYHRRSPSRDTHPPYGNGDEHWVAYAPILPTGLQFGEENLIADNTEESELIAEISDEP